MFTYISQTPPRLGDFEFDNRNYLLYHFDKKYPLFNIELE